LYFDKKCSTENSAKLSQEEVDVSTYRVEAQKLFF
jgi:hypothetical protein